MAKKKINIKSVSTDVESGDVNISYKNVRIAGLSESTTAVLETKDTICEDDIEVEYTKPTVILPYANLETHIASGLTPVFGYGLCTLAVMQNDYINVIPTPTNAIVPNVLLASPALNDPTESTATIFIVSDTDTLNVTVDNTPAVYTSRNDVDGYLWYANSNHIVYGDTVVLNITAKE